MEKEIKEIILKLQEIDMYNAAKDYIKKHNTEYEYERGLPWYYLQTKKIF
jgi:hypothetical protein